MHAVVTGVAGFIGATLAQHLLQRGDTVVGIDCFLDSYPRLIKEHRLRGLSPHQHFRFVEADLVDMDIDEAVADANCVFHCAAQAGVRTSWGQRFEVYTGSNILATQRLLEAVKDRGIDRFVYSSSSSVYGDAEVMPTPEDAQLNPVSPYAVSKLAGEHLCHLYRHNFAVPTVVLRYFTVYGPHPRPDQAVSLFINALRQGRTIQVYGDGEQLRGMTFVDDVVRANLLACERDCIGETINIGGGSSITVNELIGHLERITGHPALLQNVEHAKGDALNTLADINKARQVLRWEPAIDTVEGLQRTADSMGEEYLAGGVE
jgi:nucleoside-diphosphate-sugar epimerase